MGFIDGLIWLNNKFILDNDKIYYMSHNIFSSYKLDHYKIFNQLINNNFNFDDRLSYLVILNNNIKILDLCKRNNLINRENINKYIIFNPKIELLEWLLNNNLFNERELCIDMIKKQNYEVVKWLYYKKLINEQYIISKGILFNDINILNFIYIETGYEFFHNEFIIYRMINKMKLPVINWFLKKNIIFNTDNLFKLAFKDHNIIDCEKIINLCYKNKVSIYQKNINLRYLNNNLNIINDIDLDKIIWRYYLFKLSNEDLIGCNILNDKINNKFNEIEEYKKLVYKLALPDDIIKYHIIPYF